MLAQNYQENDSVKTHGGFAETRIRPTYTCPQPGMHETLFLSSCEAHWRGVEGRAPSATQQNMARLSVLI